MSAASWFGYVPKGLCLKDLATSLQHCWEIVEPLIKVGPRERRLGHWGHALEDDIGIQSIPEPFSDCHEINRPNDTTVINPVITSTQLHGLKPLKPSAIIINLFHC